MDLEFLRGAVRGAVLTDTPAREARSTDASIFRVVPEAVFVPEDADDLADAVRAVSARAAAGEKVSLTARAGGTCMSGGSLTESIQVDCAKLAQIDYASADTVTAGPGTFFRDVEAKVAKSGYFFPSYPASKNICAIGGIVANNAGGEKNLLYGKTNRYVRGIDVVLDDGSRATLRKLTEPELAEKLKLPGREGDLYRQTHELVTENWEAISKGRPRVTKNSSGYALWDVWDPEAKTFDLTQLVTGSQGTLCLMTSATLGLRKPQPYRELTTISLRGEAHVATLVKNLLAFQPESLESYDHHTLRLALRFLPALARHMGIGLVTTFIRFVPDMLAASIRGLPPLVLLVELASDSREELSDRSARMRAMLREHGIRHHVAGSGGEADKYWAIRRESFALLRERVKDRYAAPFIDDLAVRVDDLSEYMPRLEALMARYSTGMVYTIAGHVGDGNFHIFPLMNLKDPASRESMYALLDEAVDLTLEFGGSTSGEHNDGLIRTRYVERQFGSELTRLFERVKEIWDPSNIFNPGKKVRGNWEYAKSHVR